MARPFERRSGPKGSLPHRLGRVRARKLHAEWECRMTTGKGQKRGKREGGIRGAAEDCEGYEL